jgi:hypothetical protein
MQDDNSKPFSREVARAIQDLEFPPEAIERMHVLAEKARQGTLNPAEQKEIRSYERAGNLLAVLKSKARQRLKD